LQIAEDMCHRVGIIDKGRLIVTGSPQELKQDLQKDNADLEEVFIHLTQNDG